MTRAGRTRGTIAALAALLCLTGLWAIPPLCTCARALASDGWCDLHEVGYVAAVRIPSRLLYDALDAHGHDVDPATFTCASCRRAIETSGFCDADRVGFVNGQAYFSRLTYEQARGERVDPGQISCRDCKRHAQDSGWCKRCGRGWIGNVAVRDRAAYERAALAADQVRAAVKVIPRCERCAVAMVTSTECPLCRILYVDGKPAAGKP